MKSSILLVLLVTSLSNLYAQRIELIAPERFGGSFVPINRQVDYNSIDGTPYLNESLIKGYVKLNLGDSTFAFLRYNVYADEMEYLQDKNLQVIENVSQLDYVYVDGRVFCYKTYKFRNSFRQGYLERLAVGDYTLYLKYDVDFERRKEARSSYEKPTPDRFIEKTPVWYCSIKDGPIKNFDTDNSSLEEIFRDDYPEIKKYIKSNKLKLRKQEDMIQLFEYYNSEY